MSDFVVQEVLEQLWTIYLMKYGEIHATRAEQTFYAYRDTSTRSPSITLVNSPFRQSVDHFSGANDLKRKHLKQYSDTKVRSLDTTGLFQPILNSTPGHNEFV